MMADKRGLVLHGNKAFAPPPSTPLCSNYESGTKADPGGGGGGGGGGAGV